MMEASTMRHRFIAPAAVLALVAAIPARSSRGQQTQKPTAAQTAAAPHSAPATAKPPVQTIEVYQIDVEPTGRAFSVGKPRLEGKDYVYRQLPEKNVVRIPQSMVKKITLFTKDLDKESVYRIDLVPSGRMVARDEPKLKNNAYVFHAYKNGTLMTVKKADVKQVARLTGLPAFRAEQEETGGTLLSGNLSMEGGTLHTVPAPAGANAAPASGQAGAPAPSNWNYDGTPGVTDAYAPANATVAHPGDVPKAPEPPPPPPPR
jgi:hypothetical protein